MTIYLPPSPLPRSASPSPIVFGGWQTPPTGGIETWLGFMGSRLSMAIETPNLMPEPDGRLWTAALLDAWLTGETVACRFPQPGFHVGAPGKVVVDGAGQAGMVLNIRGATPRYSFRRRQFFSLLHGGRRYLHYVREPVMVGANGRASVPIGPMLRVEPADGDKCEVSVPMIEGKLSGDASGWKMIPARVQGLSFTISEIA
ncbi:hypothetical protein KZ810_12990 [Sphingomonas sp. RHCKR47]|uniref:hypothetical protein n=1 Tax=Sphingomonas citricola TaxID=2862498 RepID=UPI001CA48130|nr:hypothetical protein [Sphingomonas citricola]MBW6524417.1 hypothetical protein [Sphingomonas citricola]